MCDVRTRLRHEHATDRPRWGLLYALMAVPLAALVAAEIVGPPGAVRTVLGCALAAGVFGAMGVWVRLNCAALELQERCACTGATVTVRVVPSRPPAPARRPSLRPPVRRAITRSGTSSLLLVSRPRSSEPDLRYQPDLHGDPGRG
jgi:hypothetical protein